MIFLDEAGMVDHKRLDALTKLVERSGAKPITVGDGKQLPSIGTRRHVRPPRNPRPDR